MKPLVLLILGVVWGVALIPPLLRVAVRAAAQLLGGVVPADVVRHVPDPGAARLPEWRGQPGDTGPCVPGLPGQQAPVQGVSRIGPAAYTTYSTGYTPGLARARANRAAMVRRRQNVLFTLFTAVIVTGIAGFGVGGSCSARRSSSA